MSLSVDYAERDGFLVGKAARLADWQHARERDADRRLIHYYEARRWALEHPERVREMNREAHRRRKERDPDAYRAATRKRKARYEERHPERVKAQKAEYARRYYLAHREEICARAKERQAAKREAQRQ